MGVVIELWRLVESERLSYKMRVSGIHYRYIEKFFIACYYAIGLKRASFPVNPFGSLNSIHAHHIGISVRPESRTSHIAAFEQMF